MTAAGIAVVSGLAIGVVSRWIDTAAWAPAWVGNLLSPWLAGATSAEARAGTLRGLALIAGVVGGYLLTAGPDASRLAPALALLALVAGPAMGLAAAAWRGRNRWAVAGAAALGAVLLADGILLQLGPRTGMERLGFGVVSVAGLLLATRLAGRRGALLAVLMAAALVALAWAGAWVFGLAFA